MCENGSLESEHARSVTRGVGRPAAADVHAHGPGPRPRPSNSTVVLNSVIGKGLYII